MEAGVSSRRTILGAAVGAVGAWLAGSLGRAAPVAAANGDQMKAGVVVAASNETGVITTGNVGFSGETDALNGVGISGTNMTGGGDWRSGGGAHQRQGDG